MQKLLLIIVSVLFTGCLQQEAYAQTCDGRGSADVKIVYGDAFIQVTPKIHVKRRDAIVLKLYPEKNPDSGTDYSASEIELEGKKPTDEWLNKTFLAADAEAKKIVICVPEDQAYGEYKYSVKIEDVGQLDPRVEVEQ